MNYLFSYYDALLAVRSVGRAFFALDYDRKRLYTKRANRAR